jgi:hypothetical protein
MTEGIGKNGFIAISTSLTSTFVTVTKPLLKTLYCSVEYSINCIFVAGLP